MGLFNFGKTNPTDPTVSDSTSSGGSVGGSSSSSSNSSFRDPSFIWGGQSPFLEGMYSGAQGMGMGTQGQGQAQGVYDKAMQGFERLMNPGVNPQLQAYQGDVQRNLERNILPTIQGGAGMAGQMGGSRQGVAQGLAMSDANQQVTDMAANLYNQDMNRMGQTMSQAPSLGTFGQQIPWYNMNQYSGILGDPTQMQGAAGSQGTSSGGSFSSAWNESESHSEGGGGGGGWNFGIGPTPKVGAS